MRNNQPVELAFQLNGGSNAFPSPNIIFQFSRSASATLTVTTIDGCSNTHTENFNVRPQPDFTFSYSPEYAKRQTTAFNYLPNNNIPGYAWTWAFGDNTYSFIQNTTHTYANMGLILYRAVVDSFRMPKCTVRYHYDLSSCCIVYI
ncbi:MAG: hypothetical protein R2847_07415 [Bacteroidia bacterium]